MADGGLDMTVLDVGRASFYLKIAILGLIIVWNGLGALGVLDIGRASFYLKIAILGLIIVCLGLIIGALGVLDGGTASFYLKIAILGLIIVPLGVGALGTLYIIIGAPIMWRYNYDRYSMPL